LTTAGLDSAEPARDARDLRTSRRTQLRNIKTNETISGAFSSIACKPPPTKEIVPKAKAFIAAVDAHDLTLGILGRRQHSWMSPRRRSEIFG
jgi:hypothetical protein